jgi:hypothetical protein
LCDVPGLFQLSPFLHSKVLEFLNSKKHNS